VAFFVLALFLELIMVLSFQGLGLVDRNALIVNLGVFSFGISPLFYLLPITVIVVLVYSWVYLIRYVAYAPARAEVAKRPLTRRELERRRFRALRRFFKRISRRLESVESGFQRIKGVSYISKRVNSAGPRARSSFVVLIVFFGLSLLLLIVVSPEVIHDTVVGLYRGNPSFLGFVRGTTNVAHGFGDALAGAFSGVAPCFHSAIAAAGASLTGSIVRLDVASKYFLSQNLAAWSSALIAVVYGMYLSTRRQRRH
jgi:hypothetical protein